MSFANWEMEVVENPIVPVVEIARPVPRLKVDECTPPIVIEEVVIYPTSFAKAPRLFGRLMTILPEEVVTEKAFEDEARLKVKVLPATWLMVVVAGAAVI